MENIRSLYFGSSSTTPVDREIVILFQNQFLDSIEKLSHKLRGKGIKMREIRQKWQWCRSKLIICVILHKFFIMSRWCTSNCERPRPTWWLNYKVWGWGWGCRWGWGELQFTLLYIFLICSILFYTFLLFEVYFWFVHFKVWMFGFNFIWFVVLIGGLGETSIFV